MMGFLPSRQVYRNLETGETGTDYVSLLPRKLKLRRGFRALRMKSRNDLASLFHEVETVPLRDAVTPDLRTVFDAKPSVPRTRKELVDVTRARLEAVIEENWSPDLFHVVMHSSGYDSRNLSWTIKKLAEKYGEGWLEPGVMFLCTRWEGSEFAKIMRYEGWADSQYRIVQSCVTDDEYYAASLLDFRGAWRRLGGASAIPVNLYWYPIEWAQMMGLIPADVQTWTGCRGNSIDTGAGGGATKTFGRVFKSHYRMIYHSVLFQRPHKGTEVVHPYADAKLIRAICSSKLRPDGWLRDELLESMDVELARFENLHTDGDRRRPIAPWIMKRVVEDYRLSWYGREVHPRATPAKAWTEFQPFWAHWSAASLCEHLLAEGYEIRIG